MASAHRGTLKSWKASVQWPSNLDCEDNEKKNPNITTEKDKAYIKVLELLE